MKQKEIIENEINKVIDFRLAETAILRCAKTKEKREEAQKQIDECNYKIAGMIQLARALSWCVTTNNISGRIVLV